MNKRTTSLVLGIFIVSVVTVAVTYFSGSLFGRWGTFKGLSEAREALKSLPLQIGAWHAEEEGELDKAAVTMLRIQDSYIYRRYEHTETKAVVHVTIMVGPTGRVTVHTPEVCFGGKDYEKESTRSSVSIPVQLLESGNEIADSFWRISFIGRSLDTKNRISFYYAVSTGDVWSAVETPRSTFQTYRFVYKIQAEAYSESGDGGDNVKKFLDDCLPTIHEHMVSYHK